jgi:integrase
MSLYRRGEVLWFKFQFQGQTIRESTHSSRLDVARDAERIRRRELEEGYNRIPRKRTAPLFSKAAGEWAASKSTRAAKTVTGYQQRLKPVVAEFGRRLVYDIGIDEILAYMAARKRTGISNRTINYEIACIRGVLKRYRLWAEVAQEFAARDLKIKLAENHDVGRALDTNDEALILGACQASKTPALLPLFIFARDTGLRAAEMKALRRRDLLLEWKDGVIVGGEVRPSVSKTEGGKGRSVPLSPDVCSTLTMWLSRFADADADSYVFPRHAVQMVKGSSDVKICRVVLSEPMQSWQHAWRTALKAAGVHYRWHDLRHTFVSRLAENAAVSEQTIKALAGHVSKQMLERYSHIRTRAKQDAIAALDAQRRTATWGGHKNGHKIERLGEQRNPSY